MASDTGLHPDPKKDFAMREPVLWWLVAIIFIALMLPAIVGAETPVPGQTRPFPAAPYLYRYDGPDYDARLTVIATGTGKPSATYDISDCLFCDGEEDNCAMDGLFPVVRSSAPTEPVIGMICHIGAHGQKLAVFDPLRDMSGPVFEVAGDFAISLRMLPDGLIAQADRALGGGGAVSETHLFPTGVETGCGTPFDVQLPPAGPLSASERDFVRRLQSIVANRDLGGFIDLLTGDVLVSFGGNGGPAEFASYWAVDTDTGRAELWAALDRILAYPPQADEADEGRLTFPWFFRNWPNDIDAYDVYFADDGAILRAGPDQAAPVLARLPFSAIRFQPPDGAAEEVDWFQSDWLPVTTAEHCLGYVQARDVLPLLGPRIVAQETGAGWRIEAFVTGD